MKFLRQVDVFIFKSFYNPSIVRFSQCRTQGHRFYSSFSTLKSLVLQHSLFKHSGVSLCVTIGDEHTHFKVRVHTNQVRTESSFPEQQVQIHTCQELYKSWKKQKKFHSFPQDGLVCNVKYIDTEANYTDKSEKPVALCLHGAPGNYMDFQHLTAFLHRSGIRVISPNLPDFSTHKPWEFRHTGEEKAEFIKDFLQKLNIEKLDVVISHSAAVFPSLLLCVENKQPLINSLVLLSPGHYKGTKVLSPYFATKCFILMSDYPFGYMLLKRYGVQVMKLRNPAVSLESGFDNPLLSLTSMIRGEFWKSKEQLEKLKQKDFPILLAFGENDVLVEKEKFYDMAQLFGITYQDVWYYDKDGVEMRKGKEKGRKKVMAFERGSHYVFWKHPDIVEDAILQFLRNNVKNPYRSFGRNEEHISKIAL